MRQWNIYSKAINRNIAVFLLVLMITNMMPLSLGIVFAENHDYEGIVIEVTDQEGKAISGAAVEFKIEQVDASGIRIEIASQSKLTDKQGMVSVLEEAEYVPELELSATVSYEGFITDDTSVSGAEITEANQKFTVQLDKILYANEFEIIAKKDLIYTGKEQELLEKINGLTDRDTAEYKVNDAAWSRQFPVASEAGNYEIKTRIRRYKDLIELEPQTVVIQKAAQKMKFKNYSNTEETIVINGIIPQQGIVYDFSVISYNEAKELTGGAIKYTIQTEAEYDGTAAIEESTGQLTVFNTGTVRVKAVLDSANPNYEGTETETVLHIKQRAEYQGQFISFDKPKVDYIFGFHDSVSTQQVKNKLRRKSTIRYSISDSSVGLSFSATSGAITVDDYELLARKLEENNGVINIAVKAELKSGGLLMRLLGLEIADEAEYILRITYGDLPKDPYSLTGTEGENGWYISDVTVVPKEGYQISKTVGHGRFSENVVINDTSDLSRKVYLLEEKTSNILRPILLKDIKVDTLRPDKNEIEIFYSEPVTEKSIQNKEYRFYQDQVKLTFKAVDSGSGIERFRWVYQRESGASLSNKEVEAGTVEAIRDEKDHTKYSGFTYLPKEVAAQIKGEIRVTAKDYAGLYSKEKKEEGKVIVVDNITPTFSVEYKVLNPAAGQNTVDKTHYYSDSVEVIFKITESNFYAEDVDIWLTENGKRTKIENLEWKETGEPDEYQAKILLKNESVYQVALSYTDRSDNKMKEYQSDTHIVDKTVPKIFFKYFNHMDKENPQVARITVVERNFNKADIMVKTRIRNLNDKDLTSKDLQEILRTAVWQSEGDVHTATIEKELVDGIYNLTLDYKDLARNPAKQLITEAFVVDRTPVAVSEMSIQYSLPVHEMILSDITFGFYNPTVTISLTANDEISGVDHFVWSYLKQKDESAKNLPDYPDTILPAVQNAEDKSLFSASLTLPKDKADQLRGSITFSAVDKSGNASDKKTDSNRIIIVDTIAPTMTAEYSQPVNRVSEKMYYNGPVNIRFFVTEPNFYREDVKVEIVKEGEGKQPANVDWLSTSVDEHIGSFTIDAPANHTMDGDYQITVSYRDKSGNEMHRYTSDILVVDTTKPIVEVSYANKEPSTVLPDSEGNMRSYFNTEQIATVTIKERNFDTRDVDWKIIAKDVAGNPLDHEKLHVRTKWNSKNDMHTMTITYPGDANYSFDMDVIDLAKNVAKKRETDYFTVDTTVPSELTIAYSSSLLDRILESVSFGYYNAKVTVTVKAEDDISGVHNFRYYYRTQPEKDREFNIEENGIEFSAAGLGAAAAFQVPSVLTQFNDAIDFYTIDRAGNSSDYLKDNKRVIVDSISPSATVQYNVPVQTSGNISYYDSNVSATISVTESNFYPEDVRVSVSRDGREVPISVDWSAGSNDVNTGRFVLTGDGDYFVSISYTDRSQNKMADYVSGQITIDTQITEATILVNGKDGHGKSFKDSVIPMISFEDKNFDSYEIKVLRSNLHEINKDVTKEFFKHNIRLNATGGNGELENFKKVFENDGIYTISVLMRDKAGHEATKSITFSVNRFGSVYRYNTYLNSLIENGGAYVKEITEDLVVTEYNASPLVQDSLTINISLDGKPLENVAYSQEKIAEEERNSWNRYEYRISKNNFEKEGIYKITISSKDEAGNYPENNNYKDKEILFRVDKTAPEINSIVGLERQIINATEVEIRYTLYDTIGLKSVVVYVSGQEVVRVTDFEEDGNKYGGSFSLKESPAEQTVRIVVEDMAGNITDTHANEFSSKYDLNTTVTVSTNAFVRWYANKKLFWGSIAAALVSVSGIGGYAFTLKKRLPSA